MTTCLTGNFLSADTGCSARLFCGLRWSYFDLRQGLIYIPGNGQGLICTPANGQELACTPANGLALVYTPANGQELACTPANGLALVYTPAMIRS